MWAEFWALINDNQGPLLVLVPIGLAVAAGLWRVFVFMRKGKKENPPTAPQQTNAGGGDNINIAEMTGDFEQGDKITGNNVTGNNVMGSNVSSDKVAGDKIETQIIQNRDEQDRETIATLGAALERYEKQLREKETDNEELKHQLADMEGALNTALEISAQSGVLAEKARALLQGFIADPGGKHPGAQFDALIAEHEAGPVGDLVRLYLGAGHGRITRRRAARWPPIPARRNWPPIILRRVLKSVI